MRLSAATLLALCLTGSAVAADPPRAYLAAVAVQGDEAARFELTPPRIQADDLARVLSDERLRLALNAKHLADVGSFRARRPLVIGETFVAAGAYGAGLAVSEGAGLALILSEKGGAASAVEIPLGASQNSPRHVPQATAAFLAGEGIEQFDLEIRFGSICTVTPVRFAVEDVVAAMNNTAYEILVSAGAGRDVGRALRLATQANQLTQGRIPGILDTLALAQFESGSRDNAIATQRQALEALGAERSKQRTLMEAQLRRFEGMVEER